MFSDPETSPQIAQEDPSLQARWLALQSMLLNAQGQQAESLQTCQGALELAPKDDNQLQGMIYLSLANTYQQMNDYDRAVEAYQRLIQLGQMAGNSVSELLGVSGLALLALQHGQYHFAFELVTQGIQRIQQAGTLPPISTAVYGELAVIHYQWHQLEQAHTYFQRAIQVSTLSGYSDAELYYGVILSRLSQIQGDLASAVEKIQKTVDLMQVEAPAAVREEVLAQQVRIYLAQDDLAAAEMVLKNQGVSFPVPSREDATGSVLLKISTLRILLYRAQRKYELENIQPGLGLANELVDQLLHGKYIPLALEALLVRAQLHTMLGDRPASQADYIQALKLGEPEGFISVFVEEGPPVAAALTGLLKQADREFVDANYVQKILDAFPADEVPASRTKPEPVSVKESLIVPLSKRELEILQLIGEGLSNQEITERLVITLHTVKKHSSNLYAKLEVSSRTQAVAQARQLGLL
jgi:LuxR family maltose regulon positive regulatory protein